jgi:hypothetical protein
MEERHIAWREEQRVRSTALAIRSADAGGARRDGGKQFPYLISGYEWKVDWQNELPRCATALDVPCGQCERIIEIVRRCIDDKRNALRSRQLFDPLVAANDDDPFEWEDPSPDYHRSQQ